ncbi:MAG: N-6 DNA methylase [bacterium]
MDIKGLKAKWNKERDYYRKQELGTGVHSFVRACFESKELFDLKEGSLSSKLELRKREYIHENKAKEGRRADFVLYINPDIIIPLEAECYGNIKAGVQQLFNYQKDFDKHYGILTDGYIWRFYNNNIYREFKLDQIIDETDIFLEFWEEYIKPEFYYLTFFEPQGQLSLFKEEKLPVEENRQIFFDDITRLIKSFKNKLQVEGYFEGLGKRERERRAVEITYAYVIQFILYKTLVDNEFGNFVQEFKDIVKSIHDCLKVKQYGKILGVIEGISNKISQNIYRPFKKEQDFISQILLNLYRQPKNELHDVAPWLDIFVFIKKYTFANIQNEIFGYIYENYLKELYEDTKKGQYFTDPAVVNFMLHQVGFTPNALQKHYQEDKNSVSLIDPSCGSGTFLYSAVDSILKAFGNNSQEKSKQIEEVVNNNIFGLDIAEFPLYLAEMNILMRLLPQIINEKYNNPIDKKIKVFLTRDSVAEFMNTALRNTIHDIDVTGGQLSMDFGSLDLGYKSYVREESDLEEMKRSLENQPEIPRRRFDFVIGNPPYVGYNECSKQKVLIFELMKQNKVNLSNIYGMNLHSTPNTKKKRPPKPNLYAFFVALGIALLKDNGKLCFIIPQTLLTSGDHDTLRYYLAKFTTIEKIITFSGRVFIGRGLMQNRPVATSSLILVLIRKTPPSFHQVEIINSDKPDETTLNNILAGKAVRKKRILQATLLQNAVNWNLIKQNKLFLDFYAEYKRQTESIAIYYDHTWANHKFKSRFYFDIGYEINEKEILEKKGENYLFYPKLKKEYWTTKEFRGFWPNIRSGNSKFKIKLLQANQGYCLLDSKYKVIWSYANPNRFHFTSLPVVWARNQICAIGSEKEVEILYLFALLNSPINILILNSNLKSENEKDLLISITAIKEFVRVPKITEGNQFIKNEIIKRIEEMLVLEEKTLSGYVDFSRVMIQKFDSVWIKDNYLVLIKEGKEIKLQIKDNLDSVKKTIRNTYYNKKLDLEGKQIFLADLKSLPIIDFDKQRALKDYIDDLVFALYFNIPLKKFGFNNAVYVKDSCIKSPYYKLVSKKKQ